MEGWILHYIGDEGQLVPEYSSSVVSLKARGPARILMCAHQISFSEAAIVYYVLSTLPRLFTFFE